MPLQSPNPVVIRRHRLQLVSTPVVSTGVTATGTLESRALLNGAREVVIRHGGELYRLRHTRNDKLILTK